jgi:hypothetical protein
MGDGGGGEAKSHEGEKAWSSINNSILSGLNNISAKGMAGGYSYTALRESLLCGSRVLKPCCRKNDFSLNLILTSKKLQDLNITK